MFFNIPTARQVIGFIYFTFVPGFIILKLLKLNEFNWVETLLFSVGLSIAFLMVVGLLINEIGFLFGISKPLSLMPLVMTFSSFILIGGLLVYLKSENANVCNIHSLEFSPFALLFACLPILSIVGAMWVNVHGNNVMLLFMIIAISLLFTMGILSEKLLPSNFYPFALLMIAIAVLFTLQ